MFHEVHPGCTFLELYSFLDNFFAKATQKSDAFAPQTPSRFFLRAFRSNHLFQNSTLLLTRALAPDDIMTKLYKEVPLFSTRTIDQVTTVNAY